MLELMLGVEVNPDNFPVTAQLLDDLREVLGDGAEGGYDVDEALFYLAQAFVHLENAVVQRAIEVMNLETDLMNLRTSLLKAGIPIDPIRR
ncbi:hypothetical protein [Mycolicibacterium moriokaense]|uniref:Uncharacterized protein n=1 Tax=Mycolicibacterium moriokaense TaxID=39691 RepID=A0A318HLI6_9MYCO|nr:hypothetical protein [Mycolicibacterium moriokaense]PXX09236.1 hypothetical protein C8E89_106163 [Mycolicibacterium moriokaense]